MNIEIGETYSTPYPFCRTTWSEMDPDGTQDKPCWRPGTRYEQYGYEGETAVYADGVGEMRFMVVSLHKPPGFPERVFYTRQWVDPDGHIFGKNKCHVSTKGVFKIKMRGYAEEFEVEDAGVKLPEEIPY